MSNVKETPKSCKCRHCKHARHTNAGNFETKREQRAYRHDSKIQLKKLLENPDEVDIMTAYRGERIG